MAVIIVRNSLDLQLLDCNGIKIYRLTLSVDSASFVVRRVKRMTTHQH